jgi:hypothetical protein
MPIVSPLSIADQANVLRAFLGSPSKFSPSSAEALVAQLSPGNERDVARQLQTQLRVPFKKVKYLNCLQIAARLLGRDSWFEDGPAPLFSLTLSSFKGHSDETKHFAKFDRLAEYLSRSIQAHVRSLNTAFIGRVASHQEGLVFEFPNDTSSAARAVVKLMDNQGEGDWLAGVRTLVGRIRRIVEESTLRGFLDGYLCVYRNRAQAAVASRLSASFLGTEVAIGSELAILRGIEENGAEDLLRASVNGNTVRSNGKSFQCSYFEVSRDERQTLHVNTSSLFQPETEQLLVRYNRLKRLVPSSDSWTNGLQRSSDPTFSFEVCQIRDDSQAFAAPPVSHRSKIKRLLELNENTNIGAAERARLRRECAEHLAEAFQLGHLESLRFDKSVVKTYQVGIDHGSCKPRWGKTVNSYDDYVRFPGGDHEVFFYESLYLEGGKSVDYCSAVVSMPYMGNDGSISKLDEARQMAELLGWTCSVHNDWSWHLAGSTGLVLFRRTTSHEEMKRLWEGSFLRWLIENKTRLMRGAGSTRRSVIVDVTSCQHFPLDVSSFEDCRERYLKEFAEHLYWDERNSRALVLKKLFDKWRSEAIAR